MQTINISKIFILPTEPDTKVIDRFWYNPTNRILSRYTGSEWEPISVSPDDIDVNVNSQTMSLAEYIDAVTEGLLEVSSQIDSKQDKLQHYSETEKESTVAHILNTNGIHEQNVYTNEPSYSMKGWYLASKIENPYFLLGDITFDDLKNDPYANRFFVLLSDTKIPYETAKDISSMDDANVDMSSVILQNLAVGDILTIKNNWNLINAARVSAIEGNRIEIAYIFDNLNDSYMPYMFNLQQYGDHILNASVRCFAKPDAGYVEFAGENATAVGGSSNISRGYLSTNVGGRRNNTCGDFSVSIGEDNIVEGKSSVALGSQNKILQENNISIGNINEMTANVRQGFIFGGSNKTEQENSVLVGRGLTLNRQNNSLTRTIVGRFNDPTEDGAVVIGTGQGPDDLYNGAIIDRSSCTFRGRQTFEYYNSGDAFTSKHGIISLGSNNVADTAKSGTYMLGGGLIRDQYSNTSNTGTRTIVGVFNEDVSGNPAFVVGAGANANNRKNIIEAYSDKVNINGKLITKDLQCGGTSIGLGSNNTVSSGTYALGAGLKQTTSIGSQVIAGVFNKESVKDATYGAPIFTVGNGWADNSRSNAVEIYRNLTKIKNDVKLEKNLSVNKIENVNTKSLNVENLFNVSSDESIISCNASVVCNGGVHTKSIATDGANDTSIVLRENEVSVAVNQHSSPSFYTLSDSQKFIISAPNGDEATFGFDGLTFPTLNTVTITNNMASVVLYESGAMGQIDLRGHVNVIDEGSELRVNQIKLRIKNSQGQFTNEYCTIEAVKDSNGEITINVIEEIEG